MHICGKCVAFQNFFHGLGLCFGGRPYARSMLEKGRAPVRCAICRGCRDFKPRLPHHGPAAF